MVAKVKVGPGSVKAAKAAKTAIVPAKVQLPADVQAQIEADVAALAGKLAAPTGKAIQVTQSKKFRFPDGTECDSFKGIITAFVSHNAYYEGDFDPKNIVPPNCFAIGVVANDNLHRSDNAPDPQTEDGETACAGCWANQWKSAAKGNGKACKNSIKVAVLCEDGETRPLSISSTALKAFGDYVRDVVKAFSVLPYGVLTEFYFAPSDFSSVRCGNPIKLNDEQLALAMYGREDALAMLSVEPDTSAFDEKVVQARAVAKKAVKVAGKRA